MNSTIRFAVCGMAALLFAACGGSQDTTGQPAITLSSIRTSSAEAPVSAYNDVVQRVYVAYLGRPADPEGMNWWAAHLHAQGTPLSMAEFSAQYSSNAAIRTLVDAFGASDESAVLYPGDNAAFIVSVYRNLFNREPDAAGKAYWVDALDRGIIKRAIAALYIMAGAQSTDILVVDKKVEVARNFTVAIDTPLRRLAYSGMEATALARQMLSTVGLDSDPSTFNYKDPIQTLENRLSSNKLAAYLGTWTAPCDWHSRESVTVTEAPDTSNTVLIAQKTDYYATENCEGPVIATDSMSASIIAVHNGKVESAIVFTEGAASVPATVDLVSVSLPAHTMSITGTAVTQTIIGGKVQWCIDLGSGRSSCVTDPGLTPAQGPENGALYASGNQMYLLSPVGSIYYADAVYTRK